MVKAKKFIYAKPFEGFPKLDNFRLEEETLPELQNGGSYWRLTLFPFDFISVLIRMNNFVLDIMVEAIFLSVDPYMRLFVDAFKDQFPSGSTMIGNQVAK